MDGEGVYGGRDVFSVHQGEHLARRVVSATQNKNFTHAIKTILTC